MYNIMGLLSGCKCHTCAYWCFDRNRHHQRAHSDSVNMTISKCNVKHTHPLLSESAQPTDWHYHPDVASMAKTPHQSHTRLWVMSDKLEVVSGGSCWQSRELHLYADRRVWPMSDSRQGANMSLGSGSLRVVRRALKQHSAFIIIHHIHPSAGPS